MKSILIMCVVVLAVCPSYAQSKKATAKNTSKPTPASVESHLDANTAGKYAKNLGKKMFSKVNFEQEKGSYSMSINKWKPFTTDKEDGTKTHWYVIDLVIRWQSSQGGWPVKWNDVEYSGVLLVDEFGCDVNFLIRSKIEPSSKGLAALVVKKSPVGDLSDEQKQAFEITDDWFKGVNYVWNPGGCLE